MPVTTIFKPYTEQTEQSSTGPRTGLVTLFTDTLFDLLRSHEGVISLEEFSRKTGGRAAHHLLDSVRQSMRIQVKSGNVNNRQQVKITIKCVQLKDSLSNLLDNNVVSESREPNSCIAFVGELLKATEDSCIAFQMAPISGQIFDLHNLNNKSTWISRQIISAINKTGDTIAREHMEK